MTSSKAAEEKKKTTENIFKEMAKAKEWQK